MPRVLRGPELGTGSTEPNDNWPLCAWKCRDEATKLHWLSIDTRVSSGSAISMEIADPQLPITGKQPPKRSRELCSIRDDRFLLGGCTISNRLVRNRTDHANDHINSNPNKIGQRISKNQPLLYVTSMIIHVHECTSKMSHDSELFCRKAEL